MSATTIITSDTQTARNMSIKEARKRLGKDYDRFSDKQIEYIVSILTRIAKESVNELGSKIIY